MRSRNWILIFVAPLVLVACSGGNDVPEGQDPDEAFLNDVRQRAATAPPSDVGLIGPGKDAKLPRIEISVDHYQMGLIANDKTTTKEMQVFNRGESLLIISHLTTSCVCTTGDMKVREIPPGGQAVLEISVDPFKIHGFEATRTLTLHTNDPRHPILAFDVTSHIEQEFVMEPSQLDFKEIASGTPAKMEVLIRQIQEKPFKITNVSLRTSSLQSELNVEPVPQAEWKVAGKAEYRVIAQLAADMPAGLHTGAIEISTDLPRYQTIGIPVKVQVLGPYAIRPKEITLRDVKTGVLQEAATVLSAEGPVTIKSVESQNENVKVGYRTDAASGETIFDLTLLESGNTRLQKDTWNITFELDGTEHRETVRVLMLQPR